MLGTQYAWGREPHQYLVAPGCRLFCIGNHDRRQLSSLDFFFLVSNLVMEALGNSFVTKSITAHLTHRQQKQAQYAEVMAALTRNVDRDFWH